MTDKRGAYETIILEIEDRIATITLNRPEVLNASSAKMREELPDAINVVGYDKDVRVVVITGAGSAFCAGADLKGVLAAERGMRFLDRGSALVKLPITMRNIPKPIIASINGAAVGFGFSLALACDIRIASEDAKFGAGFTRIGYVPEFGSTYYLTRIAGIGNACELVFSNRIIDAKEAKEMGIVNRIVEASKLRDVTSRMAAMAAKGAPVATQLAKLLLHQGMDKDFESQRESEILAMTICDQTEDSEEGMRAFLEKRQPKWKSK